MNQYALALAFFARLLTERVNDPFLCELMDQKMLESWCLPADTQDATQGLLLMRGALAPSGSHILNIPDTVKRLDNDFFELFEMSPPKCYVHESVWRSKDKLFNEEETFRVKAWYAQYGLRGTGNHHGPEDHLGMEIGFVSHLLYLMEAPSQNTEEIKQDVRQFMSDHFMVWGLDCLSDIEKKATTDFYKGLGLLAKDTVNMLVKALG